MPSRRPLALGAIFALVALLPSVAFLRAWRYEPDFYRQALAIDRAALALSSDQLLEQATALSSEARRQGAWQAMFTAQQINGWLAVDLPRNHPDLLPVNLANPRIQIEDDIVHLACRWGKGLSSTILRVKLGVQMTQPHVLTIRVAGVRAGRVPLPMHQVLDTISRQAAKVGTPIEWRRVGGDPVAILRLPPFQHRDLLFVVRTIALRGKELRVAGHTESIAQTPLASNTQQADQPESLTRRANERETRQK